MDLFLLVIVLGCALAGGFAGATRLVAWILAVGAAVAAGRWAGPSAAALLAGEGSPSWWLIAASVVVTSFAAAGLVWVAGRGLRRALEAMHLGCLDRAAGSLAAAATALALTAVLLALAGESGYRPDSPWAAQLQELGRTLLLLHQDRLEGARQL